MLSCTLSRLSVLALLFALLSPGAHTAYIPNAVRSTLHGTARSRLFRTRYVSLEGRPTLDEARTTVLHKKTPEGGHKMAAVEEEDSSVGKRTTAEDRAKEEKDKADEASTVALAERMVYDSKITSPGASTVWTRGTQASVTWETEGIPDGARGRIILGHMDSQDTSEHLDAGHPLATDVDLRAGQARVTVPEVPPRYGYIVVLMGDSGNRSPEFIIN